MGGRKEGASERTKRTHGVLATRNTDERMVNMKTVRRLSSAGRMGVVVGVGLAMLLAGCGTTAAPKAETRSLTPITVGWEPISDAPLHLAMQYNLFATYGLKPTFAQFTSGTAGLAAMKAGTVDVFEEGAGPSVLGPLEGVDQVSFMIVEDEASTAGLVVRPNSGITSLQDLRGKSVATLVGSASYFNMVDALKAAQVPLSSVHVVDLAPSAVVAAFASGDVQAAWMWDPWVQLMVEKGGKLLAHDDAFGLHEPIMWAAYRPWASTHKAALVDFIHAISAGIARAKAHPNEAVSVLTPVVGVKENIVKQVVTDLLSHTGYPTVQEQVSSGYPLSLVDGYKSCDGGFAATVSRIAQIEVAAGTISHVPSCHAIYTPTYLEAAAK